MKSVRNTTAKASILQTLSDTPNALSQAEVQSMVGDICDRVTTYRVLDRLVSEGLAHKIVNIDGVVKYALCHECEIAHEHSHVHFSCEKCKTVTCLNGVIPKFSLPGNYTVTDVQFTLTGLCPNCA